MVDGGKTHVNVARAAAIDFPNVKIFGMVKDDYHKTRALTDGERDISIAKEPGVYAFIYNLQEEVHRFTITRTRNAKRKTMSHSSLEKIDGIGPAKAKALLSAMSLSEIRVAEKEDIAKIRGISKSDAEAIFEYFKEKREHGGKKK